MSNRLEQEFPDTGWHAVPQIGARVLDRDPVQRGVDRGRRLRAQAIRSSARDGTAATTRMSFAAAAFGRRAMRPFTGTGAPSAAG